MGSPAGKLKLHRRSLDLAGERFTVLALRPTTADRYATTEFHETWHILCDTEGAELLGRLAWAMAFQSRTHTFLLVDLPLITPDPFDTSPSSPILIVNSDLGPPTPDAIEALRSKLPLAEPSEGSVRLMTAGFDRALADTDRFWTQERKDDPAFTAHQHARWVEQVNGVVVLAAPSPVLRQWAVRTGDLARRGPLDPEWTPLHDRKWTGEVQVLSALTP
ncbi:MAG: hypothetical protein ACXVIM_12425 [Acidimicrobiia bacterium]